MSPTDQQPVAPVRQPGLAEKPLMLSVPNDRRRLYALAVFGVLLCVAFIKPIAEWIRFASATDRNTYLLLVPAISGYLIWIRRSELRQSWRSSISLALTAAAAAMIALASAIIVANPANRLSLQILSFLIFLLAGGFALLGGASMRAIFFPLGFLIFAVPMPMSFADAIEVFLQYTSAEAAYWMLTISQAPMLRNGLDFLLPGIPIHVAQECSGYNSTFALFLVSAVAGYLFLKSPWKRTALVAAVLPLAILRNGFRISTIALLCVHVGPQMINSFIHQRGGPIFFALALIPFFALLWWMRKRESAGLRHPRS